MELYREIPYYGDYWGLPIIAFDKLDGSNIRFEYSQKRGFYKFGTRQMMIDSSHPEFGFSINIFLNKYADSLTKVFKSKRYRDTRSFVCFGELVGERTEFGQHDFNADKFDVTIFDIISNNDSFLPPKQLVDDFGHCGIPKIVYEGNLNKELVEWVKRNDFNLKEGVVCKGRIKGKDNRLYYCKIKTDDWFERLRNKYPDLYIREFKQSQKQLPNKTDKI